MASSEEPTGLILESVEHHTCKRCGVEMDVLGVEPFKAFDCPECGAPFVVPARLGAFLLVSQIGRGGMGGVVFLARDELLARDVAIKIMPASVGMSEEVVATFRREAQAAARLNHPNIAQIYSFGQENGQPYIVMELLTGSSLDKMIDTEGQLDEGFVLHVGLQIAQGLRAADEASLTHGDIKPENILFDDKMNAKLVDFGIASFVNQASEGIWGTPYYIAPERLLRMKSDARSDMYCLGGTLYHALTGRPPFEGRTPAEVVRARLEVDPVPVKELRQGVHEEVDSMVMRMLKREPGVRHPTYASLIGDLTRAANVVPYGGATGAFSSAKAGRKVILTGATGRAARATGGFSKTSGQVRIFTKSRDSQMVGATAGRATGSLRNPKVSGGGTSTVRRVVKGLAWLLVLGGLAAGGVWFYTLTKGNQAMTMAGRKEQVALESERRKVPALWTTIQQAASNVNRHATAACMYTGTVIRAVQVVLNETLDLPPPPAPPAEQDMTNLVAAGTNSSVALGTNVLAGVSNAPDAGADIAVPPVAPLAEPPPLPVPAAPDPEIKALAKKTLAAVRDVLNARDTTEKALGEADKLRAAAAGATASSVAGDRVKELAEKAELCKQAEAEARKRLDEAKTLTPKVDALRVKFEQANERAKRDLEEKAKRDLEEKQKKLAVERRNAMIQSEVASAKAARTKAQMHMQQYTFGKAVEELKAERATYETDEGKEELRKSIDRYQLMNDLHRFLIDRLSSEPFGWGWISGRSAEDVTGADERGVKTKSRAYPWTEVSIRQYLHFFRHYADDRDLRAREAAGNYLAAAIFCMENVLGSDNVKMVDGARNLAREFVEHAKGLAPTIEQEVARLLPQE